MGVRKVEVRFCDKCDKEIEGRLTFRTCPCCSKDICLACIEKEDARHKPKERKQKVEPITTITPELEEMESGLNSEGLTLLKPAKKKAKRASSLTSVPDISTFSVMTGQGGDLHTLRIEDTIVVRETLKEGALDLLELCGIDQGYVESAPDSEGKQTLLAILTEGN